MKGRRRVKEGFLSLETSETWIVYVGEWARQHILKCLWTGNEVPGTPVWVCQELQRCWVYHAQQLLVYIKNGPLHKGHPVNLTQLWVALESTWASIPVERLRYLVESNAPTKSKLFWGLKGVQHNSRKVFLMFCTLSVFEPFKQITLYLYSTFQTWNATQCALQENTNKNNENKSSNIHYTTSIM